MVCSTAPRPSEESGTTAPLFRTDLLGNFEVVHVFDGSDGSSPDGGLLEASDGALYWRGQGGRLRGRRRRLSAGDRGGAGFGDGNRSVVRPCRRRYARRHHGRAPLRRFGRHDRRRGRDGSRQRRPAQSPPSPRAEAGTLNDVTVGAPGAAAGPTLAAAWFADFNDVPQDDIFHAYIETIFRAGYGRMRRRQLLPQRRVRRDQMAVFLLKAEHGGRYVPPACSPVLPDVPCPGQFADSDRTARDRRRHRRLRRRQLLPGKPVTRAQSAVFLLKTKEGSSYVPPPAIGIFGDVPQDDPSRPGSKRSPIAGSPPAARPLHRSIARPAPAPAARWQCLS